MKYYIDALKKYATLEGRTTRKEFWLFVFMDIVIFIVFFIITTMIVFLTNKNADDKMTGNIVSLFYLIFTLIPTLAICVRRLHDAGKSGLWLLINLVPFIGQLVFLYFLSIGSVKGEYVPINLEKLKKSTIALSVSAIIIGIGWLLMSGIVLIFCDTGPINSCTTSSYEFVIIGIIEILLGIISFSILRKLPKAAFSISICLVLLGLLWPFIIKGVLVVFMPN